MAWSFRRRIKIIPGVHLNFSKSGISTSIGFQGASLTLGKSGTHLNTSIPGLGIHNRQKISGGNNPTQPPQNGFEYLADPSENIFSADVQEITSQDMQGIKQAILTAREERKDLRKDISKTKSALTTSKIKLGASYLFLIGLIKNKIKEEIKTDIKTQKETLAGLHECLESCYVKITIGFEQEIEAKYNNMVSAYQNLITSNKIWDVTSAHSENRAQTRSVASTVIQKKEVKFDFQNLPEIKTDYPALHFQNANGADLYFYPSFIVMFQDRENFALIGYDELEFDFETTRFVEEDKVPSDTKTIEHTWKKVNKNGSQDLRFKDNYQIPIVRYGGITLKTNTGLQEEYSFSNFEYCVEFSKAFLEYKIAMLKLKLVR
ncbi:DUF4236 domain-containing protein [Haliscomenobacter sp.]|uniref:DUF4236 domain-containing protein n=1 Tax=Haliscomenobacter sp. TaxID=2717303 RepID=UPI003593951E